MPVTHLPSIPVETMVAVSLLRAGGDTRVSRIFQDLLQTGRVPQPGQLLRQIDERLGGTPGNDEDRVKAAERRARRALAQATASGIGVLSALDPAYPEVLRHISDPPVVLWTRGDTAVLRERTVALVGSRSATPSGLTIARTLARDLAAAGVAIISGLARGIDAAAHRGALEADGATVAVLGSGVDVVYPPEHAGLAGAIAGRGVILSELPPGTRPYARHFPLRNRIISGLSRAVVVVEASERSGSLITARAALDQGRDVLAVPGNVTSGNYRGCHRLIRDGARLVESVDDILDETGWSRPEGRLGKTHSDNQLAARMQVGEAVDLDTLAERTGWSASTLLAELSRLELSGTVGRTAGGNFVRLD